MKDRIMALLRSSFAYVWLAVLAAYFVVLTGQSMLSSYHAQQDLNTLKGELFAKQQEQERLTALISYYQTDNYKEKILRQDLLLKMPNETVYALPESSIGIQAAQDVQTPAPASALPVSTDPYWKQWMHYLFNRKV
jgi:cell division protein FtsB